MDFPQKCAKEMEPNQLHTGTQIKGSKMRLYILGAVPALILSFTAAAVNQHPSSLEAAVSDFNRKAALAHQESDRMELTANAVIAAIRWNLLPTSGISFTEQTKAALEEISNTRELPESFQIESNTTFEPNGETVFTAWTVRLVVPNGPNGETISIPIQNCMIDSRVMGPRERRVVRDWQNREGMRWSSWANQTLQEERDAAREADEQDK